MSIPEKKEGERKNSPMPSSENILFSSSSDKTTPLDNIALYFSEISKAPLLTDEEEKILARKINEGKKAQRKLDKLQEENSNQEELETLQKSVIEGEKAKEQFISSNLRLVVSVAKKYQGKGVPFSDLIQEGNIGLITAIDKFDPDKGFKFSTYGVWWIQQAIIRAIAYQGRTIRLPVYKIEQANKMLKTEKKLSLKLDREPTLEELAEELGVKPEKVKKLKEEIQRPFSLEKQIGAGNELSLGNFIEDVSSPNPLVESEKRLLEEELEELLNTLTPREGEVIRSRFGLKNGRKQTLEEIGQKYGITRERIRQIEAKALRKLRHPSRTRKLKDYLSDPDFSF